MPGQPWRQQHAGPGHRTVSPQMHCAFHESSKYQAPACRTPEALLRAVEAVLTAYEGSRGGGSMLGQASALVNPQVITRLGELRDAIRRDFT